MAHQPGVSPSDVRTTIVRTTYSTTIDVPYEQLKNLVVQAMTAKDRAYCPYSRFRVGCAVLTDTGAVVTGVNVENASYPVGICAERCAIARAVAEGHRRITAVAVATDNSPPAPPCGMCRQFMREFALLSMPVILLDKDCQPIYTTLEQLLPMSFGPDDLHGKRQGQKPTPA